MNARAAAPFVFGLAVSIVACGGGQSESAREAQAMKEATPQRLQADGSIRLSDRDRSALGLVVAPVTEADLPNTTLRFGKVASTTANQAQAISPVTGTIVRAPLMQIGATIAAGAPVVDVVPVLDASERISLGTQSAQRQGEIESAQGELAKAEADLARARSLSPQVVSAAKVQEAETAVATARARLEGLRRAGTVAARVETQPATVTAPIGGTVVSLTAHVGASVKSGDVLAEIVTPGPLWIDVSVPPNDSPGDSYEVLIGDGSIPARFLSRGAITDVDGTRHDRLTVDARHATRLTPGASVSVRVGHGAARGAVLPEGAIVPGVEGDAVFVETSPGVFASRPVRVAARFGGRVRLASGLTAGDRVVVQGGMALEGERRRAQLRPEG